MRLFRRKSPSDQLDPQLTALRFENDGEGEHKKSNQIQIKHKNLVSILFRLRRTRNDKAQNI